MSDVRAAFIKAAEAELDKPTLMGAKGDDAFDCSGLVTWCLQKVGGPDLKKTHNANRLGKETRPLTTAERPLPGDLIFFDAEHDGIDEHVGIVRTVAGIDGATEDTAIDAEGATHSVTSIAEAVRRHARVRLHSGHRYRRSFRAIHRNVFLDRLEVVER